MTSEYEPTDYPKSMEQILTQYDFNPLIIPKSFHSLLYSLIRHHEILDQKIPPLLERFYMGLLFRSYIIEGDLTMNIEALQNASSGKSTSVLGPVKLYNPHETLSDIRSLLPRANRKQIYKRLRMFAVICEQNCVSKWNVAFFGKKTFHRIVSMKKSFFSTLQFWRIKYPNFMTVKFPDFMAWFVQSGIYQYEIGNYRMRQQLKLLQKFNRFRKLEMGNGSLFSYVFLANSVEKVKIEEEPANLSAFSGTFIITILTFNTSLFIFAVEVLRKNYNWRF
ncbi:unnamed protein product [Orchesella dallaii]|uniref:Pex N-terminal domain-containing protein n=1 Tax=Orchesella dallaii TaxID=48710 RepID=A0ABP1RGK0_9HEXA